MPEKSKIYISPPQSSNSLVDQIWAVYDRCPRNTKSRAMQRLLEGGIALENLGILDAVIALALSEQIAPQGEVQNKQTAASVLSRLMGRVAVSETVLAASEAVETTSSLELGVMADAGADRGMQAETATVQPRKAELEEDSGSDRRRFRKRSVSISNLMSLEGNSK